MSIELSNLRFTYKDSPNQTVLHIDHWQVGEQEQVFIHGPSGSGKSSLLNIISGVQSPDSGDVYVLKHALHQMKSRQRDRFRAQNIGYVFQQFNLIPYLNAIENIELGNYFASGEKADKRFIQELLKELNIAENLWLKPCSKLSIGQQQRIAIARALVNKPRLLIADEASSSIDYHNRDMFMKLLMSLSKEHNISLLFVSHDMSLKHYFPRVEAMTDINRVEAN
ncbi:ABC transporter ATP-binding protein [Agaribacterium haliotis]|uniref:ABC transporter ATP-binding protein n=1 Tax=Agaribacterium haliotis TaxID=2013869 RepID=UPI000BB56329|nr:ABC transporter ATP-binding protein [Agaribacterium haliotis]